MGMYDSVWVRCPHCGIDNEFQSKSGDCFLNEYSLDECPEDVLLNVNRHAPIECDCGCRYMVDTEKRIPIEV